MKKTIFFHIFALCCISLMISSCNGKQNTASEEQTEVDANENIPKGPHLIEVGDVKQMLESGENVVLIEVSKQDEFEKGHIAGAFNVWRPDYGDDGNFDYDGMRANKARMEALLSRMGVMPESKIVLYEAKGGADAIRMMWLLDMYGHEKVYYMNGGKTAWKQDGHELTTEATPVPEATAYTFAGEPTTLRVIDFEDVVVSLEDENTVFLDTRTWDEYAGNPYIDGDKVEPWKNGAYTFGRIPNSVHLEWVDVVDDKGDRRFIGLDEMRAKFEKIGVTPDKKVIAYCQSGVRSAHSTYVLTELLGYPDVRNYDGSWIEWSYNYVNKQNVPIERDLTEAEHAQKVAALEAQLKEKTTD